MKEYLRLTLAAALLITVHEAPAALPGKRADYLRAEAACFQARGYVVE